MKSLTLIRGLPGSGKSTLAKSLCYDDTTKWGKHLEADMFFVDRVTNEYKFDPTKIKAAHEWCQKTVDISLGYNFEVFVSNTFTTLKELRPYFLLAKKHGIIPQVILCQGNYGSIHDVPEETLQKMKARFQYDIKELYNEFE